MLSWQPLFRGFGMGKLNGATKHTLLLMLILAGAACDSGATTSSTPPIDPLPNCFCVGIAGRRLPGPDRLRQRPRR
jgi:hypothetical protein